MIELTDENFRKETAIGTVLVDCWANWCGVCKMTKPSYDKFAEEHKEIKCCTFDVDKSNQIIYEIAVTNLPTFILYKDGKQVKRGGAEILREINNI